MWTLGPVNEEIVSCADVLISGLIFAFALATLPRAFARFSRWSDRSQGLSLRLYSVVESSQIRQPIPQPSHFLS